MQAITRRLPTAEQIDRNKAKLAGFAAGIAGPLVLALFMGVVYTGESAFVEPRPDETPVYPVF